MINKQEFLDFLRENLSVDVQVEETGNYCYTNGFRVKVKLKFDDQVVCEGSDDLLITKG